jgi:hypothetical protein
MKTHIRLLFMGILFTLLSLVSYSSFADEPNPPIVPGQHGQGGDVPVGAPVDNGIIMLLAMGAGYGAYKLYMTRKEKTEEAVN